MNKTWSTLWINKAGRNNLKQNVIKISEIFLSTQNYHTLNWNKRLGLDTLLCQWINPHGCNNQKLWRP